MDMAESEGGVGWLGKQHFGENFRYQEVVTAYLQQDDISPSLQDSPTTTL